MHAGKGSQQKISLKPGPTSTGPKGSTQKVSLKPGSASTGLTSTGPTSTGLTSTGPTSNTTMGLLESFYDPTINAPEDWSDDELEYNHDFIQWLFPIPESSRFNARAPPLDRGTRDAFLTRQELRDRMLQAWKRMMAFYGWNLADDGGESTVVFDSASITPRDDFLLRAQETWLVRDNHNHMRISRMIRSMRILGLYQQAQAMLNALTQANNAAGFVVKSATTAIWFDTALRPTCYPPVYPREPVCDWLRGVGESNTLLSAPTPHGVIRASGSSDNRTNNGHPDYEDGTEHSEDHEEGESFRCDGREIEFSPEYSMLFLGD
ncbi:hypothetical protein LTR27_003986 [Elasticomyces elasticus]|nr:hypothetical protein LTR27_003986 [Elasticomyces elasticus]